MFTFMFFYMAYLMQSYTHIWELQAYLQYIIQKNPSEYMDKDIYFPDNHILQDNWKTIRDECNAVIKKYAEAIPEFKDIESHQELIIKKGIWKTYILRIFNKDHKNGDQCPETMKLIQKCKGVRNAFFSILKPNTILSPHVGPYYGVYRYHLPLVVPQPDKCELIVNGITKRWVEGEGFMFDDTYLHSASNTGTESRIVLFLDIDRNDIGLATRLIDYSLNTLMTYTPDHAEAMRKSEPVLPIA